MRVTVNGKTIEVADGSSVTVRNGEVLINSSVEFTYGSERVTVQVQGDCGAVQTVSGDVQISGSVRGSVTTVSGDVKCGVVDGSVRTVSGDVYRN